MEYLGVITRGEGYVYTATNSERKDKGSFRRRKMSWLRNNREWFVVT